MVVDMIDTCSSDGNNESETPSLVDPVSSDDEDSDSDDNDDAAGDAPTINHVLVLENIYSINSSWDQANRIIGIWG